MRCTELDTPALTVDLDVLEHNIDTLQRACNQLDIALRVHTKTHKTPAIARMQVEAGASRAGFPYTKEPPPPGMPG